MQLKKQMESLTRKRDRAQFEHEAAQQEAKKLGVTTTEEANKQAELAEAEAAALEEETRKNLAGLQDDYQDLLRLA